MPTEWVSPEEPERRRISVTIWATDRVSQRGTATFCPHYSLYFLQTSVRLSNACHYLTLIYLIKKRLCVSFLIVMYIIHKLHTLKSCPYLSVTNQCLINLLGRKMNRRPPPKIWINIQQQLRCQRTLGLIVSLTTVSKQPLVLKVFHHPHLSSTLLSLSWLVCPPLESPPILPVPLVPLRASRAAASLTNEPENQCYGLISTEPFYKWWIRSGGLI